MQKRSKLSTRLKKNKQSALVYTSQVNLLTQHIVWEFKSIIPHESMLLTTTALIQGWVGDALSPSMEKAGSKFPLKQCQVSSPRRGTTKRAGVFSSFLQTLPGPDEWSSLTHPGSPQSHLSILAFHNRSGQSLLIIYGFAILAVHYLNITFGKRKPYKILV